MKNLIGLIQCLWIVLQQLLYWYYNNKLDSSLLFKCLLYYPLANRVVVVVDCHLVYLLYLVSPATTF